ncbi:hypothetical protein Tco_0870765 [Tanacetum coccineum]
MMLDRFTQHTVYPLALMSNVSHPQYHSLSSTTLPSTYVTPHFADNTQPDTGISPTDKLNKSILTIHFALLHPNHTKKTYLKQTNTLKTSLLKTRNQATVQVRQGYGSNVQGRQNKGQGNNPLGGGATGYGGAQNRVGNTNPGQARQIKCYNYNAQRNGVGGIACKRLLLFLAAWTRRQLLLRLCYEHTDHDLALNVDNVFQVNDCDAFDSDVDEAPMAQTMFMANLSSADPVYDEAGPSYDSDILSECQLYRGNASLFQMMHIMIYNDMNKLNILERRARFELMEQEQKIDETIKEYFWSSQLASSSSTPSPTRFISLQDTATPSSLKTTASAEYTAWTTTDTILKTFVSSIPEDLHMDDDTDLDEQVYSSGDEDIGHDHIPTVNLKQNWWKLLTKDRPATPEPACSCKKQGITETLKLTRPEGPDNKLSKSSILMYNVSKPLPLGGPPGQVTIQSDFFFNKDLEYLRYGSKIPDQMWIEEECKYDIAAMYGISHWWFQRQRFYIDRHTSEGDRRAVRTHMRILSVVRIEVFSLYGYDYMKTIVLRRADLNEYIIAERDFKYLYPSDFEDLYLLNLQGHLNHLPPQDKKILSTAVNLWIRNLVIRQRVEDFQLGIESYQTQLNLTKPRWDATGFEFKHDFTVIDSPRAVTFRDKYGVQMIMRFNEIHKFSDDTLQQIDEALDYRVKEFKVNRMNPGLNTRFWTRKDVERSKEFMFAIQKWLKTRRIFRNLESFVGGRIREGDYRLLQRTE